MSVVNVENSLVKALTLLSTGEFILGQGHMSVLNVGNSLVINPASLNIRESTQEQGLMCAANVGKPSAAKIHLFSTR